MHSCRTLRTNRSAKQFARGVRGLDHPHAFIGEYRVEPGRELRVPIPDQEPERAGPLPHVEDQVTGLLGGPLPRRVRGDAEQAHPTGHHLHHEQHIDPAQRDRVQVEEVAGQQALRLATQELPPARVGPAWRRPDPVGGQDPADRAGTHPVPKPISSPFILR